MWGHLWQLIMRFRNQALDWARRNARRLYDAIRDGYSATVEYCTQNPSVCRRLLWFLLGL